MLNWDKLNSIGESDQISKNESAALECRNEINSPKNLVIEKTARRKKRSYSKRRPVRKMKLYTDNNNYPNCDNNDAYDSFSDCDNIDDDDISELSRSDSSNSISSAIANFEEYKVHRCFRSSLFDFIPPYIFFDLENREENIPKKLEKSFTWKHSKITPIVIRKIVNNSGFQILQDTEIWTGIWGKHMKSISYETLKKTQKINHFPGSFQIGRKDNLWRNIKRCIDEFGFNEFGFLPKTYILPKDTTILLQDWDSNKKQWIIKPPASSRGTGIKIVNKWYQLPKKKPLIVQKYISNPLLINGNKFDLRIYVLLTSINPLRIYLYTDGLVRFASVKYSKDKSNQANKFMHLTNYSINKTSETFENNENADSCSGHKWTLLTLWKYFEQRNVNTDILWNKIKDCIIKTFISSENHIVRMTNDHLPSRYNSYELFGFDFILDDNFKLWLLEVNISPSLHTNSMLDSHVKAPLACEVLNLAQYHIPKHLIKCSKLYSKNLSPREIEKHRVFEEVSDRSNYLEDILTNLTHDDVKHLCQSEDELVMSDRFERIYPTKHTYVYHQYMPIRYYNRLFDAWEHKYSENRDKAIQRLQLM